VGYFRSLIRVSVLPAFVAVLGLSVVGLPAQENEEVLVEETAVDTFGEAAPLPDAERLPPAPPTIDPAVLTSSPVVTSPVQPEPTVRLTFPNTSVNEILSLYEVLTDKRLVRDSMLAQGSPLTIIVPGEVPRSEAIRLIEASLLLNGYTFVPVDERTMKILGPSKGPRAEGVPIYSSAFMLPESDQVVSYFMKLSYLAPQEAAQLFQMFVSPPKPYTAFLPVPNVQAVLITESAPIVRQLVSLQAMVDVPPAQVMTEFIELKRADAERVVELLQSLLDQRKEGAPTAPGQTQPQMDEQGQVIQASLGTVTAGQFESNLVIGETQFVADPRTNRILVVTRPVNFPYIKVLIEQLDAAVPLDTVLERPLKFVSANDMLPVLRDLLSDSGEAAGGTPAGGRRDTGATIETGSTFGQGIRSEGGGGGLGQADRIREPTIDAAPESIIIGKTKIIADKSANSIIVIGPPDSRQKVSQLLDMLDVRPRQVYLAAVIGELTLSDDMEFGVSYFLKYQGGASGAAGSIINSLVGDGAAGLLSATRPTPSALNRPGIFPNADGLTVYATLGDALDIYARALEKTGRFKVLSRPVVYTTNNKKAVISAGREVPFTSSTLTSTSISGVGPNQSAGVTANISYKNVLLKLEVVPLINANKDVTLVIAQTKQDVIREVEFGGGNKAPEISAQELTTTVTVPNGGTVVLGGLIQEDTRANDSGVPFLMRVPVLGYLFKTTTREVVRRELLILIQPTVVEDNTELAQASAQERFRTEIGDETYAEADAWTMGRTPVVADSPMLTPDSRVRKPRDPLTPAGVDYQEYAPEPRSPDQPRRSPPAR
jgi:general secretion pathway protein D